MSWMPTVSTVPVSEPIGLKFYASTDADGDAASEDRTGSIMADCCVVSQEERVVCRQPRLGNARNVDVVGFQKVLELWNVLANAVRVPRDNA